MMFRKMWRVPDEVPKQEELSDVLEDLYPNEVKDKKSPKSEMRLTLAKNGCTYSMVYLAKKIFDEHPVTDGISMEVAFRWLIKAGRGGDEAAVGILLSKRKFCPPLLAPFVDNIIGREYREKELPATYTKRIASRFKRMYTNADEKDVTAQVLKLITGENPTCESLFAQRFRNTFDDLFALGVTLAIGGFVGHSWMASFDHLLSHKLAPTMDAFFAFLCTVLLIVSMQTYCAVFTCGMYSKVMRLDAKYRDCPLPFRLRTLWTRTKLQLLSLFCVISMIGLSVLAFGKVSLTVFSCTTYLIMLIDLVKHLHWWSTSHRMTDQHIGRFPLLLKLISAVCVSSLFSFTKAELQDTIITLTLTLVAGSILFLSETCSVFAFTFLTSEYSIILQGLSVIKTGVFIIIRQLFLGVSRNVKALILVLLALYAIHCIPSTILFHPKDTTPNEIYEICRSTPSLEKMVACSQLEGRALSGTSGYVQSIRLLSRSNMLESIGVKHWSFNDGFVEIGVDSFEKVKVEVKLTIDDKTTAFVVFDDDALDLIRRLKKSDHITVSGIVEQARTGPEVRLAVHTVSRNNDRVEIKKLDTAMRLYWKHVLDVLLEWKNRIQYISSAFARDDTPGERGEL
ncbi:hypothetical protein BIW11_01877 [Tropilaelaps mercedesae]|uniref:Uncharacterized protein n=1 Tax=Tropilaelaps mercedesae TaxID=418985 RepID=A0A1V9X6S5_9ACAR|nr:hypothetical protein BIW11_01877 [Tropilaelaps mercedesae]